MECEGRTRLLVWRAGVLLAGAVPGRLGPCRACWLAHSGGRSVSAARSPRIRPRPPPPRLPAASTASACSRRTWRATRTRSWPPTCCSRVASRTARLTRQSRGPAARAAQFARPGADPRARARRRRQPGPAVAVVSANAPALRVYAYKLRALSCAKRLATAAAGCIYPDHDHMTVSGSIAIFDKHPDSGSWILNDRDLNILNRGRPWPRP
jgi:hypothetical protein